MLTLRPSMCHHCNRSLPAQAIAHLSHDCDVIFGGGGKHANNTLDTLCKDLAKAAVGIGAGTLTLTLEPKTQEDGNKLAAALEKLAARDPGFRYSLADAGAAAAAAGTMDFSERFSKTAPRAADFRKSLNAIGPVATLEGEGELHLQLVCARLAREFKVQCAAGRPQVASKLAAPSKVRCMIVTSLVSQTSSELKP